MLVIFLSFFFVAVAGSPGSEKVEGEESVDEELSKGSIGLLLVGGDFETLIILPPIFMPVFDGVFPKIFSIFSKSVGFFFILCKKS